MCITLHYGLFLNTICQQSIFIVLGGHLLASGEFGDVYLGLFNDGLKIAIKRLQPSAQRNMAQIGKDFANEIKMLTEYKHKNLIHLLGYCKDCPFPCLVRLCAEFVDNQPLDYLVFGSVFIFSSS